MAELIDCCVAHRRAYKKLIHDWTQGRIARVVYDQLWEVLRNASQHCTPHVDFDADIEAFAL